MRKNEPIEKILTREVASAHVDQKVSDIRKLISEGGFHHVPILSGKKLIGLISASDLLGIQVEGLGSDDRSMDAYIDHQFSIKDLMKTELTTISTRSTIADAAEKLSNGNIHAIPVINDEGELEGMVTSTDLIRFLRDLF